MRRLWMCTLSALLLLGATPLVATASASSRATGMTTVKVKDARVSVQYPSAWLVAKLTPKGIATLKGLLGKKNPKLAAQIANVDLSQYRFYAIDPAGTTGDNMSVGFEPGSGRPSGLAEFTDVETQQYKSIGAQVLDTKVVKMRGATAYRVDVAVQATAPTGVPTSVRVAQLEIFRGNDSTTISVGGIEGDETSTVIEGVLSSVHLT